MADMQVDESREAQTEAESVQRYHWGEARRSH